MYIYECMFSMQAMKANKWSKSQTMPENTNGQKIMENTKGSDRTFRVKRVAILKQKNEERGGGLQSQKSCGQQKGGEHINQAEKKSIL
jgi:hypothetical protein